MEKLMPKNLDARTQMCKWLNRQAAWLLILTVPLLVVAIVFVIIAMCVLAG